MEGTADRQDEGSTTTKQNDLVEEAQDEEAQVEEAQEEEEEEDEDEDEEEEQDAPAGATQPDEVRWDDVNLQPALETPAAKTEVRALHPDVTATPLPSSPGGFRPVPGPLTKAKRLELWLSQARKHAAAAGLSVEVRYSVAAGLTLASPAAIAADNDWGFIIEKDVPRTGIHKVFRETTAQATLSRLLRAFTRQNPSVGYLQSLAPIGAVLLLVANMDEDAALELLTMLVHVYFPTHFDDGLCGLLGDLDVFHLMLADRAPDLYAHLLELSDKASAYPGDPPVINAFVSSWLSTLFIYVLPLPKLLSVWDAMFTDGSEVVLRCILSLFLLMKKDLLQLHSAVEFYAQLQSIPTALANRDDPLFPGNSVLKHAYALAPFPWPGLARMRASRAQSLTHSTSFPSAAPAKAPAPRSANTAAAPATRADSYSARPPLLEADAEAWDDVTFSAPALHYFGLRRPSASAATAAVPRPAPATMATAPSAAAVSTGSVSAAGTAGAGADMRGSIILDELDDALDDVDLTGFASEAAAPPQVQLLHEGANTTAAVATPAHALPTRSSAVQAVAGKAPHAAHHPDATAAAVTAVAGVGAKHGPVAMLNPKPAAAWELVDSDEASDAAMRAGGPDVDRAALSNGSVAAGSVPPSFGAGFGLGLLSRLAEYYYHAVPSGAADPRAAAAPPGGTAWVPVATGVSASALAASTADGSFYGFISDRLRLRDPSRDPRLKALAKQLRPEDVDRTIQTRRTRHTQRYRLWHMNDASADEQNDVLAEVMRTVHASRPLVDRAPTSSTPSPSFLGLVAAFVARQLDSGQPEHSDSSMTL